MLSRRILRTKVLQALYAFFQSEDEQIDVAEKNLLKSIDSLYDLYIYQLSIILELVDFIKQRQEENKLKHLPSDEDLNPNTKFVDNRFVKQLYDNKYFKLKYNQLNINWSDEQDMFRQLYNVIKESKTYEKYARSFDNYPYESDKKFILNIFRKYILDSEAIYNYFEDKNIHWGEDFYDVALMVVKTIEDFKPETTEDYPLPELFNTDGIINPSDDLIFVKQLFRKTIIHSKEFENLIGKKAKNWETDRIAVIDMIILKMGLTEIIEFPDIPVKVSMNEYIDISKDFSTEKSRSFINGVLDKITKDLNKSHKINKINLYFDQEQDKFTTE
ncbi:MAG: transcription antitermination factor NusB [Bacteroidota bacterium]